jgi:hypothetical protein
VQAWFVAARQTPSLPYVRALAFIEGISGVLESGGKPHALQTLRAVCELIVIRVAFGVRLSRS